MTIEQALEKMFPGQEWVMSLGDVSTLVFLDGSEPPSEQAIRSFIDDYEAAEAAQRDAAIAHAKSLGFTDEMIAVMYPGLTV